MASAFAHAVVPLVIYAACKSRPMNLRLLILAIFLSILPDLDVIAFTFAIPYESQFGHRGFTHSLVLSALLSTTFTPFEKILDSKPVVIFLVCFVASASHAVLDAMTNGGLGVALYWPFSQDRIFFALRPIQVSPIGIEAFFTVKGLKVISSELIWIFVPGLTLGTAGYLIRRRVQAKA